MMGHTRGRLKKELHGDKMAEIRRRAGITSQHPQSIYLSKEEAELICQLLPVPDKR